MGITGIKNLFHFKCTGVHNADYDTKVAIKGAASPDLKSKECLKVPECAAKYATIWLKILQILVMYHNYSFKDPIDTIQEYGFEVLNDHHLKLKRSAFLMLGIISDEQDNEQVYLDAFFDFFSSILDEKSETGGLRTNGALTNALFVLSLKEFPYFVSVSEISSNLSILKFGLRAFAVLLIQRKKDPLLVLSYFKNLPGISVDLR